MVALREFQFVRLKPNALKRRAFPLRSDDTSDSPLAGPFSPRMIQIFDRWIGVFPFARRIARDRRWWKICPPKEYAIELEVLSDGSMFARVAFERLNVVCAVYLHLVEAYPDIGLEDCATSIIYSPGALPKVTRVVRFSSAFNH